MTSDPGRPIALFYHCWTRREAVKKIMAEQLQSIRECGLLDAATEFHVGHNGGPEGLALVRETMPEKSELHHCGDSPLGEIPTLQVIHQWIKNHPNWDVCYLHTKGASHNDDTRRWRKCLEQAVLGRWGECVGALKSADSAGAHWMTNAHGQWFWGGNFWWCRGEYLSQLPPPVGADRWQAELWVSNVTKTPVVKDLADHTLGACP